MARTGVVHRDKRRGRQPGAQNILGFGDEIRLFVGQQTLQLTLRDRHAQRAQATPPAAAVSTGLDGIASARSGGVRDRNGHRSPPAAGPESSAIRRDPTFALVTGRAYRNHQILHQKRLMTLESRSVRDRDFHHLIFDANPRCHLAAEPPLPLCRASPARCPCPCRSV